MHPWEEEFSEQLELCERLLDVAEQLPVRHAEPSNEYQSLLLGFFAKILNGLHCVVVLCRAGRATTALPLLRVMFEDSVNLNYIKQQPEERAIKYLEYSWIEKKLMLDDLRAAGYEHYAAVRERAENSDWGQEYPRVKDNYPDELSWEHFTDRSGRPRGLKPFHMAKQVGAQELYRMIYPYASKVAHSTATGLSMYLSDDAENGVVLVLDPSAKEINGILGPAFEIAIMIVKEAIDTFAVSSMQMINSIDDEGKNIFPGDSEPGDDGNS